MTGMHDLDKFLRGAAMSIKDKYFYNKNRTDAPLIHSQLGQGVYTFKIVCAPSVDISHAIQNYTHEDWALSNL